MGTVGNFLTGSYPRQPASASLWYIYIDIYNIYILYIYIYIYIYIAYFFCTNFKTWMTEWICWWHQCWWTSINRMNDLWKYFLCDSPYFFIKSCLSYMSEKQMYGCKRFQGITSINFFLSSNFKQLHFSS